MLQEILRNELLPRVQKPGQYLGMEWGAWRKDWDSAKSRIAIIYPDLYELGMSNFGIKILYNIVNNHPDYLCDRAYAPMQDMEKLLRERDLPLWGWESYKPLTEFDMLGLSLAYELCYSSILTILDLSKIPFKSLERNHQDPVIFAGGPAVFNPEVMADYIDFYIVGDGEELITEIQDSLIATKKTFLEAHPEINAEIAAITGTNEITQNIQQLKNFKLPQDQSLALREQILFDMAQLQGIYVPRFYKPDEPENYSSKPIREGVPYPVYKRITKTLEDFNQPIAGPVPLISTVQDKQVLEIRRGCDRGCRFCQVGYTYLPVRERSPEDLFRLSQESVKKSGYEDFTLLSLSASDYTCLTEAARAINDEHAGSGVSLSMPSQRADRFNLHLASEVNQVRKSGMTFAPEAGTERLRKIINKGLSETEIKKAIYGAYLEGWSHIKLYFMTGLPFETDEDLDGILDILSWTENMAWQLRKNNRTRFQKAIEITCTISTFVPKSFTAFQWFSQCGIDEFQRKQDYLMAGLKERRLTRSVKLNCTEPGLALIEGVLSRGDRRWGQVIEELWSTGSRFESWAENFDLKRWTAAAAKFSLDLNEEATRHREPGSKQPWDVLSIGFTKEFLVKEWNQAVNVAETLPCTENKCHACGVCFNLDVKNLVTKNLSDANPFVTEIDVEKRKTSCANFIEDLEEKFSEMKNQSDIILEQKAGTEEEPEFNLGPIPEKIDPENQRHIANGPKIIVKNTQGQQKLRLKITKLGDLKYIGHLDFQRLVERALRRTDLPVIHSTGFNQRMKVTWGNALPLFLESEGEYLEIELAEFFGDLEKLKQILNQQLPKEARIVDVVNVTPEEKLSISKVSETVYQAKLLDLSLTSEVNKVTTGAATDGSFIKQLNISQLIDEFLLRKEINILKFSKNKNKNENSVDIRSEIKSMKPLENDLIEIELSGALRADQVLNALLPNAIWSIRKTTQKFA